MHFLVQKMGKLQLDMDAGGHACGYRRKRLPDMEGFSVHQSK
jgi:hypothetical protein